MTTIEWTDVTWNPTTGCDRVSPGCDNCYALTMAKRLKAMGSEKYQRDGDPKTSGPGFGVSVHEDALSLPFSWRKPRKVFVNSMSDLFHAEVSSGFIARVFAVMSLTPQHTYQILTKRHARMRSLLSRDDFMPWVRDLAREMKYTDGSDPRMDDRNYRTWPLPNVWLGVSVEDQRWANIRIPALLDAPAAVRFISAEPLLGPVHLRREWLHHYECPMYHDDIAPICACADTGERIDWVITGGESGRGARPIDRDWVRSIRDQCLAGDVRFLHKQWGGIRPKAGGRELDGRTWDEYPSGVTPGADR